jgi:hypothetical protein
VSDPGEWSLAFARQAQADFATWEALQVQSVVPACHRLLFLQMSCEKLCKSHLIRTGSDPQSLQSSHGYIEKPLPTIIRQVMAEFQLKSKGMKDILRTVRHLAREIEALSPALNRDGRRPDNCEYPWDDAGGKLHSPLDWSFVPAHLLLEPHGRTFLKFLRVAVERAG